MLLNNISQAEGPSVLKRTELFQAASRRKPKCQGYPSGLAWPLPGTHHSASGFSPT